MPSMPPARSSTSTSSANTSTGGLELQIHHHITIRQLYCERLAGRGFGELTIQLQALRPGSLRIMMADQRVLHLAPDRPLDGIFDARVTPIDAFDGRE